MNEAIETNFKLKKIYWQSTAIPWFLVFEIKSFVKEFHYDYKVKIYFDEEPFQDRIKEIKNESEIKPKLIGEDTKKEIEEIKQNIRILRENYKDIDFEATLMKADTTKKYPVLTFAIGEDLLQELDKVKDAENYYKLNLKPNL